MKMISKFTKANPLKKNMAFEDFASMHGSYCGTHRPRWMRSGSWVVRQNHNNSRGHQGCARGGNEHVRECVKMI